MALEGLNSFMQGFVPARVSAEDKAFREAQMLAEQAIREERLRMDREQIQTEESRYQDTLTRQRDENRMRAKEKYLKALSQISDPEFRYNTSKEDFEKYVIPEFKAIEAEYRSYGGTDVLPTVEYTMPVDYAKRQEVKAIGDLSKNTNLTPEQKDDQLSTVAPMFTQGRQQQFAEGQEQARQMDIGIKQIPLAPGGKPYVGESGAVPLETRPQMPSSTYDPQAKPEGYFTASAKDIGKTYKSEYDDFIAQLDRSEPNSPEREALIASWLPKLNEMRDVLRMGSPFTREMFISTAPMTVKDDRVLDDRERNTDIRELKTAQDYKIAMSKVALDEEDLKLKRDIFGFNQEKWAKDFELDQKKYDLSVDQFGYRQFNDGRNYDQRLQEFNFRQITKGIDQKLAQQKFNWTVEKDRWRASDLVNKSKIAVTKALYNGWIDEAQAKALETGLNQWASEIPTAPTVGSSTTIKGVKAKPEAVNYVTGLLANGYNGVIIKSLAVEDKINLSSAEIDKIIAEWKKSNTFTEKR